MLSFKQANKEKETKFPFYNSCSSGEQHKLYSHKVKLKSNNCDHEDGCSEFPCV